MWNEIKLRILSGKQNEFFFNVKRFQQTLFYLLSVSRHEFLFFDKDQSLGEFLSEYFSRKMRYINRCVIYLRYFCIHIT